MTDTKGRRFLWIEMAAGLLATLLFCSCQPCAPLWGPGYPDCEVGSSKCEGCADKAKVCAKPTVEALAHDLDELEEHIERYGSVVAKQPDVWGQARLTKHREEFEEQMYAELGNFYLALQGSVSMSDQAYFADAFALSAAASRPPRRSAVSSSTANSAAAPAAQQTNPQQSQQQVQQPNQGTIQPLPLPEQTDTFAAFSNISRTKVNMPAQLEFAYAKQGITVEPTVLLDQKARYLDHLHELRRINEGDDTADSPGYALNLVRIPISILPGKCTDVGCAAEVTLTMAPYLSEELLPTTFRNFIFNDLVDHIGLPVTVFINNTENRVFFPSVQGQEDLYAFLNYIESHSQTQILEKPSELKEFRWKISLQSFFARPELAVVDELIKRAEQNTDIGWGQNPGARPSAGAAEEAPNPSTSTKDISKKRTKDFEDPITQRALDSLVSIHTLVVALIAA